MAYVAFDAPVRARSLRNFPPSHLLSASALTSDDVDAICQRAEAFESGGAGSAASAGRSVALVFFQPSTRTRIGFQVAAVSLGANPIGIEDMSASRSNQRTGETLEDCGSVFSNLCDAIVVRHHERGAAARMASRSRKPVINAGDGWNEHPTQALIDVFALRRGLGSLRGRTLALAGDPRGRTVRSLVTLLGLERPAEILFCPPPHVAVPDDLVALLREHRIRLRVVADVAEVLTGSEAVMMAPYDMSDIGEAAGSDYVSPRRTPDSHVVNAAKIAALGSRTLLYHPLPRQDEIAIDCDDLDNAMYFEQVRLSKFVRMAVLERALSAF
jgi:aspartate carbamoyltransferase catalytic subunit